MLTRGAPTRQFGLTPRPAVPSAAVPFPLNTPPSAPQTSPATNAQAAGVAGQRPGAMVTPGLIPPPAVAEVDPSNRATWPAQYAG